MTDTYEHFEDLAIDEVKDLIAEIGNGYLQDPLDERHNYAPSIREFFALVEMFPKSTLDGYTIREPRDDYRVSIDGITIIGDAVDVIQNLPPDADEESITRLPHGQIQVYLWWD